MSARHERPSSMPVLAQTNLPTKDCMMEKETEPSTSPMASTTSISAIISAHFGGGTDSGDTEDGEGGTGGGSREGGVCGGGGVG